MYLKHLILLIFYAKVVADNDFILDYYKYKKVPSVVGFLCKEKMGKNSYYD